MQDKDTDKETIMIIRDGQPPIRFKGERIGYGCPDQGDDTRGTNVSIYETGGGKYVGKIERWTRWQGESGHTKAASFAGFSGLIEWLKEDCGDDKLGSISQEAIEDAIKTRPGLRILFVEEVE